MLAEALKCGICLSLYLLLLRCRLVAYCVPRCEEGPQVSEMKPASRKPTRVCIYNMMKKPAGADAAPQ